MKLQEELMKDFRKHKIVVNILYCHIQKGAILKSMFDTHAAVIIKRMVACKNWHSKQLQKLQNEG